MKPKTNLDSFYIIPLILFIITSGLYLFLKFASIVQEMFR